MFENKRRQIIMDKLNKSVSKTYSNQKDLVHELKIQTFLSQLGLSPACKMINKYLLKEQLIEGEFFVKDDQNIKSLAQTLKGLHNCKNPFIRKNNRQNYKPLLIIEKIVRESKKQPDIFFRYSDLINPTFLFKNCFKKNIVHSDLNSRNIIFAKNRTLLIDWIEYRIDYHLVDIANLFFQNEFSESDKRFFSKYYGEFQKADWRRLNYLILLQCFYETMDKNGDIQKAAKIAKQIKL